jgi:large subunit ribosomal protein L27
MATRKAGGSAKNLTDSNAQYLGTKLYAGEKAKAGAIIIRQRGTRILPGLNVGIGKDHTLYALKEGTVSYGTTRKTHFDGKTILKKVAHVK